MSILDRFTDENHIIHFDNEPIIELSPRVPWEWNTAQKIETIVNDFRMVHDCANFADWCADCELEPDLAVFDEYYLAHTVTLVMRHKLGLEVIQALLKHYDPETPINLLERGV